MTDNAPLTFGAVDDHSRPLAVLVHGFPDTPHTWRHLGPALASGGYRVVAPWLPGYTRASPTPIDVGTYVRTILDARRHFEGDARTVLIGHDWGANASYGAASIAANDFAALITLAVPPTGALGTGIFSYPQLRRSFYIWFIQQIGLAEAVLLAPGFWESLWSDWSPGYDAAHDLRELRKAVTADNIASVLSPYRASFNPDYADSATTAEAAATMADPPIPTLYLHGACDGAIGAELLGDAQEHLTAPGAEFRLLDGVGHFLHLEDPLGVWMQIQGWLAQR